MHYESLINDLLEKRGIRNEKDKEKFLHPSYTEHVHDPFLMKGMNEGVERLKQAIEKEEKIIIYSDYDCDGIPGAALWNDFFQKIGYKNVGYHIPDRHDDGYGLHQDAIKQFAKEKVNLIITVDLGITAMDEVKLAKELRMDVIVTDHHEPHDEIPDCIVIDPKQKNCPYPWKGLCGTGVAFKMQQAFVIRYGDNYAISLNDLKWSLDLVAIATLADMVPLQDENRVFAKFGLIILRKAKRPGIRALLRELKIEPEHLVEDDVTFMIAPRINAASRMDSPARAFELLSAKDDAGGRVAAEYLSKINDHRKVLVAHIMKEVKKNLASREEKKVIVIGNPMWRVGILGLVAGKLVEQYERPVFVWGREGGDEIKGSCRGDGTVHVVDLMHAAKEKFLQYGGHEGAGGFTLAENAVHTLDEVLNNAYEVIDKQKKISPPVSFDAMLALTHVSEKLANELSVLAPFGLANPKPILRFENVTINAIKFFGKANEHLELKISDGTNERKAFTFFMDEEKTPLFIKQNAKIHVHGTIDENNFRGRKEIRIRIVKLLEKM